MVVVGQLKAIWLNLLAVATLAGGVVLFFVDPVRSWTGNHGRAGWAVASVLIAVVLALLDLWLGERALRKYNEGLLATRTAERDTALSAERELADESESLKRQLARQIAVRETVEDTLAELRRQPTGRDKAMFEAVIDAFPREGVLYTWLDALFSAKSWRAGDLSLLYDVQTAISNHRMVDDAELADPLDRLEAAIRELLTWMALNGDGNDDVNATKTATDATWTYRAYDGEDFRRMGTGGWPEADEARDAGIACAKRVLDAREEFERIGRARHL